jgi:Tfp pilus assembly protein PilN
MLRINLLPDEFKSPEKTSLSTLLSLTVCTFLSVSALCCVAYLYFGVLKSAEMKRDIAKEEYENLAPMAKYADDLDTEKRDYMKRSQAIKEIEHTRIMWTKKIDQLLQVINNHGMIDRHWAWLKELRVKMGAQSRDPGMEIKGFVAGDQYERLSNFNEDLKNHPLYQDFCAISNPTGSITFEKKMIPPAAIEFDWELKLIDKTAQAKPAIPRPPASSATNKK